MAGSTISFLGVNLPALVEKDQIIAFQTRGYDSLFFPLNILSLQMCLGSFERVDCPVVKLHFFGFR
ncbi:hypothetical protein D3C87_1630650 [compost metagenome]